MKKKKLYFLGVLLLAAAISAGCGNGSAAASTSAPSSESAPAETTTGKVESEVLFSAETEEDTTPQSIEYIRTQSPLFADFLEKRSSLPISMVTQYEQGGQTYESGFVIKDEHCMAQYIKAPDGTVTRAIFDTDTGYQINSSDKTVYKVVSGNFYVDSQIAMYGFSVPIDQAKELTFSEETAPLDGVEYTRSSLIAEGVVQSEYYFDKDSGELRYIVGGGSKTKILVLENSVYDESLFEIPSDYRVISDQDELNELLGITTYTSEEQPKESASE